MSLSQVNKLKLPEDSFAEDYIIDKKYCDTSIKFEPEFVNYSTDKNDINFIKTEITDEEDTVVKCELDTTQDVELKESLDLATYCLSKDIGETLITNDDSKVQLKDCQFSCDNCSFTTKYKKNLTKHMLIHKRRKMLLCELCSYKTYSDVKLKRHEIKRGHIIKPGDEPIATSLCAYNVKQTNTLAETIEKPLSCEFCSFRALRQSDLSRHIVIHTGEKMFSCGVCSHRTSRKSNLDRHLLSHTGDRPFACVLCTYRGKGKSDLARHAFTHTGTKPFSCDICNYRATRKSGLNRHILIHTREKKFSCPFCSHRTGRKTNLKRHLLTHTGERPFSCDLCSYRGMTNADMTRHRSTHTRQKAFSCDFCSYSAHRKAELTKHILIHT